ncbi:MAG: hypothetical protein MHM6MM_004324 [Cercozoa sp. M6MM]
MSTLDTVVRVLQPSTLSAEVPTIRRVETQAVDDDTEPEVPRTDVPVPVPNTSNVAASDQTHTDTTKTSEARPFSRHDITRTKQQLLQVRKQHEKPQKRRGASSRVLQRLNSLVDQQENTEKQLVCLAKRVESIAESSSNFDVEDLANSLCELVEQKQTSVGTEVLARLESKLEDLSERVSAKSTETAEELAKLIDTPPVSFPDLSSFDVDDPELESSRKEQQQLRYELTLLDKSIEELPRSVHLRDDSSFSLLSSEVVQETASMISRILMTPVTEFKKLRAACTKPETRSAKVPSWSDIIGEFAPVPSIPQLEDQFSRSKVNRASSARRLLQRNCVTQTSRKKTKRQPKPVRRRRRKKTAEKRLPQLRRVTRQTRDNTLSFFSTHATIPSIPVEMRKLCLPSGVPKTETAESSSDTSVRQLQTPGSSVSSKVQHSIVSVPIEKEVELRKQNARPPVQRQQVSLPCNEFTQTRIVPHGRQQTKAERKRVADSVARVETERSPATRQKPNKEDEATVPTATEAARKRRSRFRVRRMLDLHSLRFDSDSAHSTDSDESEPSSSDSDADSEADSDADSVDEELTDLFVEYLRSAANDGRRSRTHLRQLVEDLEESPAESKQGDLHSPTESSNRVASTNRATQSTPVDVAVSTVSAGIQASVTVRTESKQVEAQLPSRATALAATLPRVPSRAKSVAADTTEKAKTSVASSCFSTPRNKSAPAVLENESPVDVAGSVRVESAALLESTSVSSISARAATARKSDPS